MTTTTLPALIQQFFTDRLCTQMEASPNTIAGYRDTFRLLLRFASEQTGRAPTKLRIEDHGRRASWATSSPTSKVSAATAPAAAMPVLPRSDPSSGSWR